MADGARETCCFGSGISWGPRILEMVCERALRSHRGGCLSAPCIIWCFDPRDVHCSRMHPSVLLGVIAWKRACIGGMTLGQTNKRERADRAWRVNDISINVLDLLGMGI